MLIPISRIINYNIKFNVTSNDELCAEFHPKAKQMEATRCLQMPLAYSVTVFDIFGWLINLFHTLN